MASDRPEIPSSDRGHVWTLTPSLSMDRFGFEKEGALALLLLAMHISDERPWAAARNPVFYTRPPGDIDREAKRILAKRFRPKEVLRLEKQALDPIPLILKKVKEHNFESKEIVWPQVEKMPGKLLPRKLSASVQITVGNAEFELYARNFTEMSQCLHAELVLLFALSAKLMTLGQTDILQSFKLHSSLKPCKMCAAFLHEVKEHTKEFLVTFDSDDPGPLARNTALDRFGYSISRDF